MQLRARNQLAGRVKEVKLGDSRGKIVVDIGGGYDATSSRQRVEWDAARCWRMDSCSLGAVAVDSDGEGIFCEFSRSSRESNELNHSPNRG